MPRAVAPGPVSGHPAATHRVGACARSRAVATYGALSNRAFVELVYNNVLGRQGDGGGVAHWEGQLNGGRDRGSVMVGFSESAEFILATGTTP